MKRVLFVAVVALLTMGMTARADAETSTSARAAILIERESGRVLVAQNADARYPMASTTKIMTALLAIERCDMKEIVTAGPNASGVTGTSIYLSEGEKLTMRQMLQGLMLRSGNDAAVAIAEHIAGSVEEFAKLMNARADELGADAVFVTPNGLDAGDHSASARAMALIAREAMGNQAFRELVATQEAVIPWVDSQYNRVLRNKNKLLTEYEGATGIKTGFTKKAGRCLVFSAERGGMELIGATLNCPDWFNEAERLLDWGFDHFSMEITAQAGEKICEAKILNGEIREIALCAEATLQYPLCEGDDWQVQTQVEEMLEAPVRAGDSAGYMALVVNGEEVARTELVSMENVEKWNIGRAFRRVLKFWRFLPES